MTPPPAKTRAPPHMNGEGWLLTFIPYRESWIRSLIFSSVLVRFSVQPSSSYLAILIADIGGIPPGNLDRSTSLRVGRRNVFFRISSRTSLRLMKSTNALADSGLGP